MSSEMNSKQEQLRQRVQDSLRKAESYTVGLRKTYTRLVIGGLVSSAATTLVAGGAALQGPQVRLDTAGWQLACLVAALLSFFSTVFLGIGQQLKLGERVPQGQLCLGRLQALDLALVVGNREWGEIANEYEEIVKEYAIVFS